MEVLLNIASRFSASRSYVNKNSVGDDKSSTINIKNVNSRKVNIHKQVPMDISFENVNLSVSLGFRKGMKKILHHINGKFRAGHFIAILGPSGAGKTTLLDVLSGYHIKGANGAVYNNDIIRDVPAFRKFSCYITQENHLQPLLTVWENMAVAADLKLGLYVQQENKDVIVKDILATLSLDTSANVLASCLSGGQQKRLAIAIELIDHPSVMFFDEPTTGLDSSSSGQCLRLLQRLSREGKTIICTIHQASAGALQLFDEIYILGEGRCLYQGTAENIIEFLNAVNIPCPKYNNPIDYVIELASSENKQENITIMTKEIQNGKCSKWKHEPKSSIHVQNFEQEDLAEIIKNQKYERASLFHQFKVLSRRNLLRYKRDTKFLYMRFMANIVIGLLYSMLYWQIGNDGEKVRNNYNLLFCVLIHNMVTTMVLGILSASSEILIITNEYFNKRYSLKMYFASATVCEIPILVICCLLFTAIVYPTTGQPLELHRVAMFTTISVQIVLASQSVGTTIGTALNVMNGTFMGFALSAVLVVLSGLGEDLINIPTIIYWIGKSSFTKYGLEGIVNSIYGFKREPLDCPDELYCHYKYPNKFMKDMMVPIDAFWLNVIVLSCHFLIFKFAAFFILKWRVGHTKRPK